MAEYATGTMDTLNPGDTLLVGARKVNSGKIQLEFAEIVQTSDRPVSLLTILNRSDERFATRARRCWVTAEPSDASETFGVNFGDDGDWYMSEKGEVMDLNILNPVINETRMKLRIVETTTPNKWQEQNLETSAKRRGKEGDYITHKGDYIFSNTMMVLSNDDVQHILLESDTEAVIVESKETNTVAAKLPVSEDSLGF
tara:strand:+ start:2349 stop:2945 length:597 start_codon:yes stop_codon:yes gene_type:complete